MDVVEGRAAARGRLVGSGQSVDTATVFERLVGPNRFGDHDAPAQSGKGLKVNGDGAAFIADPHLLTIGETERCQILRMNEERGPALALS